MNLKNTSEAIASNMEAILQDPKYTSMFSTSSLLEKVAFKRVADEDKPTEVEIEFSNEVEKDKPLEATASLKTQAKQAGAGMDTLVKSAFDALMQASSDLDAAGFDRLSSDTLVLMNSLIVEAKAKKDKKDKSKEKMKDKSKDKNLAKDKAKAKKSGK